MYTPALLRPAPVRKRLWQGAVLLAAVTLVFGLANFFLPAEKRVTEKMLGHDFLAFYTGGTFVRENRAEDLYDLDRVAEFERAVGAANGLEMGSSFGPWWNPPHYAWVFAPLSALPFSQAVAVWTLGNVACLLGAVLLLMKMIAPTPGELDARGRAIDWRTTGLVPMLVLLSMPFVQAISHGQNTFGSLLILTATVTFWRQKRMVMAGMCCGLLAYKPQLAAVLAMILLIDGGVRALMGLSFVGSATVLLTQLTLPGTLVTFLRKLPDNVRFMQIDNAYMWERHATLKGFWRLLIQGRDAGEPWLIVTALSTACVVTLGAALFWVAARNRFRRSAGEQCWTGTTEQTRRDRLIAATICCAPLLMPFYFDYDLLLLSVPATLLAAERLRSADRNRHDAWLTGAWAALYVLALVNPGVARASGFNGAVVLLSGIAGLMIWRAGRDAATPATQVLPRPTPVTITRRAA